MRIALELIRNPVTGEQERVAVDHNTGFVFQTAECAFARRGEVRLEDFEFSYPDKAYISRGTGALLALWGLWVLFRV